MITFMPKTQQSDAYTRNWKTTQVMPQCSVSLKVPNPAPHTCIDDVKQSLDASWGEMDLTFCEQEQHHNAAGCSTTCEPAKFLSVYLGMQRIRL